MTFGVLNYAIGDKSFRPKCIEINETIRKISCGSSHIICLSDNGKVFTIGSNQFGQRGNPKIVEGIINIVSFGLTENFIDITAGKKKNFKILEKNLKY